MTRLLFIFMTLLLPLAATAEDLEQYVKNTRERIFLVTDYRYDPGEGAGDPEIGISLCGTRCNALSADYRNITEPGGWRLIKISSNRELTIKLNNPFMAGDCICTADEYLVKIDDRNFSKEGTPVFQKITSVEKQEQN